jgi:hypothetical protein
MPRNPKFINWREVAKPTPPHVSNASNRTTVWAFFYLGIVLTCLSTIFTIIDRQSWPTFIFAIGSFLIAGIVYVIWQWLRIDDALDR